ncbi:MAG: hypothetical protein PVJ57_15495 [Phycisphaerae bacterium]|jgi:hypothetical protein
MSFRETILREVDRQGLSGYRIAKLANMPARTVQAYLAGQCDLMGERVALIAAALDLELRLKHRGRSRKG